MIRPVMKNGTKRKICYMIAYVVPIVILIIHMYKAGCYPFGDKTILMGDANSQYISFMKLLIDNVRNGESILFDWHIGMGSEFYQIFCYYLASPFNLIAIMIGMWNLELGVVVTMLIQIGMCSVTMMYYLGHTIGNRGEDSNQKYGLRVLFSISYAMCDYLLAYQYNYIWLISLIMAPLIMLGVEKLVYQRTFGLYSVSLIIVFATNFYFAWFICILSFIWFIDTLHGNKKDILNNIKNYFVSSILAALSASFVLLPCYFAVKGRPVNSVNVNEGFIDKFGNIANYMKGFLWGDSIDINGKVVFTNNNYVGLTTLILALLYMFVPNIKLSRRIKRCVIILLFTFFQNWAVGVYIFHGFTFPNQIFSRNMFILMLILIMTAFETIINIDKIKVWRIAVAGGIMCVFICIALFGSSTEQSATSYIGSIFICTYLFICLVLYAKKSIAKKALVVNFIIVGIIEIVSNAGFVSRDIWEYSKDYKMSADMWADDYSKIKNDNGERKTSWIDSQNSMSYSDTNIYSSIMCRNMLDWNSKLGLAFQSNGGSYAYKGSTPLTALLSNVRYVLTDQSIYFGGYECSDETTFYSKYLQKDKTYSVYKSDYLVGLGFMVPESIRDWSMSGTPFEVQNQVSDDVLGLGDVFTEISDYDFEVQANGCDVLSEELGCVKYRNSMSDTGRYSNIVYSYLIPEDMDMYVCVKDLKQVLSYVYVDSVPLENDGEYLTQTEMLHVGKVKKGQLLTLIISNNSSYGEESSTNIYVYKYNDIVMDRVLETLEKSPLYVEKITMTHVLGNVNADKEGVLYTSIPYYKGFKVYVDGKKSDIIKIGNTMCGVELTEGKHIIEFRYMPYGLKCGSILSVIGLVTLYIYMKKYKYKLKREKPYEKYIKEKKKC